MHYQKEYFLTGDERKLKADDFKRYCRPKLIWMFLPYLVLLIVNMLTHPYGTKLIKDFFSESMKNDQGEEVSTKEIKKILETVIEEEDKKKPLTDDKLAKILKEKGYPIARRTVAKYREQLRYYLWHDLRKKI